MSKERLEGIKERVNYHGHLDDGVEWLIEQAEQAQELEYRYEKHLDMDIRNEHKIIRLEQQNKRYREVIKKAIDDLENECLWDALVALKALESEE